MNVITRYSAPIVATVAMAAALLAAPLAGANSNQTNCRESGGARVCQKQGHTSLHAKPEVRSGSGQLFSSPWLPGYGRGHLPPLLALD